MKKITIHQTDAFTTRLFGGNPAGVVPFADKLTDDEMKNIAREMNLSETVFILKPTQKNADIKLRYFTSGKAEIKFCGHATIASLYEIARTGLYRVKEKGKHVFNIETNAGILSMTMEKKSDSDISVIFTPPSVQLKVYKSQHSDFAKRFGISEKAINKNHPIMFDKNLNYIYLAITSLKELGRLTFNFQHIIDNFKDENIVVFCLLTPETFAKENNIHARGIAPLVGVPEDPFTGSMQVGLAIYALKNKLISSTKTIKTEQGHFLERPGFATITIPQSKNKSFTVMGKGVHVFSGEIIL